MNRLRSAWLGLLPVLVLLGGCVRAPLPGITDTPGPAEATAGPETTTPAPEETAGAGGAEGTATAESPAGPITLRIWLPPQFAPDPETATGALLDDRLDTFALLHPGIRITARIKDERGAGGMVASLSATSSAVPDALPDLVLMPRLEMERALQNHLLLPYDAPLEPEWYDFARALASVEGQVYGRPFAADALALIYRPDIVPAPPRDWTTTINTGVPLLFAGGSQEALFTLALYSAAGGRLLDADQRPYIDDATLTALYSFYKEAADSGVIPDEVTRIASAGEVYDRFATGQYDLGITWVSNQLQEIPEDIGVSGLPTVTSVPYSLANGWMWVLSNPDPVRLQLAEELAAFLTEPAFLGPWTESAGYLPPRADALAEWPDSPEASLASRLVLSANPVPPLEIVEEAGPALQQMLAAVITGEMTPAEAAAAVVARVNDR